MPKDDLIKQFWAGIFFLSGVILVAASFTLKAIFNRLRQA